MSPINANVSQEQITASVSGDDIAVAVPSAAVGVSVAGGIGPQGPTGVTQIAGAVDVEFTSVSDGDVIRYASGKWRNTPEANITDGGHF